jgi:NNP family nitrate/nitrite transporter-like MFS transporter
MKNQLTSLNIFSLKGVQMRTFHTTWLMFFVCFFGWFGLAPLMPTIRAELHLTKAEVGNTIIASVAATIIARLINRQALRYLGTTKNCCKVIAYWLVCLFFSLGWLMIIRTFLLYSFSNWSDRRIICDNAVSYLYDVRT